MKKTAIALIGLTILLSFWSCREEPVSADAETIIPVKAAELVPKAIQEFVTATGTAFPLRDVQLKTEQAGRYLLHSGARTARAFRMNDGVRKDEILISLDNPEFVNQIAFESKKLQYESAQREYTKQQGVYDKGGITLKELTDSQRAFLDSTYSFDNVKLSVMKLEVRSPFDGVIVDLPHFTDGQWVESGTLVVRIMDYSRMYADLTLPGKEMDRVARGHRVVVTDYGQAGRASTGTVNQISPALDVESRMFKIRIDVPNLDLRLKPGSFIKTDIIVRERASTLVIPKSIILDRRGAKAVFIVERGIALERRIETGMENIDEIEVVNGLKASDRVVTEGFETLRDRSRVKIVE